MKVRKNETTKLRSRRLGATEDRVGDRTGSGAGFDISSGAHEDRPRRRPAASRAKRRRA